MPEVTLNVLSVDSLSPPQAISVRFSEQGGTIGRDDGNTMSLPDKHRRVSRLHGTISFVDGSPTLSNSSTSLPIMIGEQQLDYGESIRLTEGLQLEFGPYVVVASLGVAPSAPVPNPALVVNPFVQAPATVAASQARAGVAETLRNAPPIAAPSPPIHPARAMPPPSAPFVAPSPLPMPFDPRPEPRLSAAAPIPEFAPGPLPGAANADPLAGLLGSSNGAASSLSKPTSDQLFSATPGDPFADLLSGSVSTPVSNNLSSPLIRANDDFSAPRGVSADPLAALGISSATTSSSFAPPSTPATASTPFSRPPAATPPMIPDDFNPFDLPSSAPRNASDPLADLLGENKSAQPNETVLGKDIAPPIESLFPPQSISSTDPFAFEGSPNANVLDGSIGSLTRNQGATDPLALFNEELVPTPRHAPMRDNVMEIGSAFQPPNARFADAPVAPPTILPPDPFLDGIGVAAKPIGAPTPQAQVLPSQPQPIPAMPQMPPPAFSAPAAMPPVAMATPPMQPAVAAPPPPPMPAAAKDALTQAFLDGAGLQPSALAQGLTPENMRVIGSLLRSATSGAIDMLAARAATKREVQANVTIIAVSANNPLKFLPNADSALQQLLGKKMPGFMRADLAMSDAFDDLRAHEVGVIAGTRAALNEVLAKFDPAILGDKLAKGSVLETLMPSARKAKLWDRYLERYQQIRTEAEDDFQSIFGRAFVEAYERETQRIKDAGGER
jgi:FHA domain-containing protein